jgi:hypothetical protein
MSHRPNSTQLDLGASPTFKPAFARLLAAFDYAEDSGSDRWEFAVAIRFLKGIGLNDTDLRWLVRKGFVEHAREVTAYGDNGRAFRPTGDLTFSKRTCFILTDVGASKARSHLEDRATSASDESQCLERVVPAVNDLIPNWNVQTRELSWNGEIVKRFKWHAVNQEWILSAFQEEGWPERIDDPLPPQPDQDAKRRLSDTIKCLNRKQISELIHFRGDGTGEGVVWSCNVHGGLNGGQTRVMLRACGR